MGTRILLRFGDWYGYSTLISEAIVTKYEKANTLPKSVERLLSSINELDLTKSYLSLGCRLSPAFFFLSDMEHEKLGLS